MKNTTQHTFIFTWVLKQIKSPLNLLVIILIFLYPVRGTGLRLSNVHGNQPGVQSCSLTRCQHYNTWFHLRRHPNNNEWDILHSLYFLKGADTLQGQGTLTVWERWAVLLEIWFFNVFDWNLSCFILGHRVLSKHANILICI